MIIGQFFLIGGIYKIVSKILSKRISCVLDSVISSNQSAFIGSRQILDSIVVLNEAIDEARKTKKERLFFKIDFAKAYDSVDWGFIENMLLLFGFHPKWRMWVMECITTASASVLVNGSSSGEFKLQRGLRQGDPLSPFLFILAAEGLSLLMKRAVNCGIFQPVEIGLKKIQVSHLQFADDTIFMGAASIENIWAMRRILRISELMSGLKVNFEKCCLYGENVNERSLQEWANILGCNVGSLPLTYLGIKVGINHRKYVEWKDVVKKIRARIQRWEGNKFSIGARITLLNSILSSLPTYYLSFYKIPKKALRDIESLQRNFLCVGGRGSAPKILNGSNGKRCVV